MKPSGATDANVRFIADYWGKAHPKIETGPRFHPLAYHCLDVAAAGEALLAVCPQLLSPLSRATGLPAETVHGWLLFLLALHDVGKFADCFQSKVPEHWRHCSSDPWQRVKLNADPGHGRFGLTLWRAWSDPGDDAMTPLFGAGGFRATDAFTVWMQAVAGHHGRPVDRIEGDIGDRICLEALADARAYALACASLFSPAVPEGVPKLRSAAFRGTSWLVAGLAMVSDWIGSNQFWFPYQKPELDLRSYFDQARVRARTALTEAGLSAARVSASYALANALPGIQNPEATPLQTWAAEEAAIAGQSLVIIEDLTGAGKTEAGLLAAHRLMRAGAAEGIYWALPTMATADALYTRLAASYGALFEDARAASLALAHGAREFNEIFQKSIRLEASVPPDTSTYGDAGDDADVTASAACARWIADDRRKTFLADVGVGTIDQALLGVLPSKHQAMRLAGLARRVLVIDEAHSFDAYMTALTEGLLRFHAALGGSAVIMSATLTKAARGKFAKAFAEGAGWPEPRPESMAFPLATVLNAERLAEHPIASSRGTRRDLKVERLNDEAAAIEVLAQAHARGQGAVWIRNTVQDAMDAYAAVRERLPDADVDLFHARFALADRLAIERDVLAHFGKETTGDQRRRIVIATQVVEQSLDCDWDVMISDLAPVDLLIQRAGRLHRHDHRGARPAPILYVVGPDPSPDAGSDWYKSAFPRAQYVYQNHGQLWLTMRALLDVGGLKLESGSPRDLIERVFETASADIPPGLQTVSAKVEGADMSRRGVAGLNLLCLKDGYVPQAGSWDSDTRTPTRLGDPQRVLRLAKWDGTRLIPWAPIEAPGGEKEMRRAWRLSEVPVLASRVAEITYADGTLYRAVETEVKTWPEAYDPPLLVALAERDGVWEAQGLSKRDDKVSPIKLIYCAKQGLKFQPM